jgi:hypothetical protein
MPRAFQLLASLTGSSETEAPTTNTAAVEGAGEAETLTTAAPRRRRDLQVSIIRKGRHNVLTLWKDRRQRETKQRTLK